MPRNERGIALLLCILSLVILSGIAIGMLYMTDSETMINNNYRSSQQAYFAALAGLQNVRERMTPANTGAHALTAPTTMPGSNASVLYVTNPHDSSDGVTLGAITDIANTYYDGELKAELTAQGIAVPLASSAYAPVAVEDPPSYGATTAPNMGLFNYKWVRVTLKANKSIVPSTDPSTAASNPICYNGSGEIPAAKLSLNGAIIGDCFAGRGGANPPPWNPVYQLTSLAAMPTGATRMLQMEVAQEPPLSTNGAVDSQDNVHLNGQLNVNGYDYCSCSCTTKKVNGIDVFSCTDRSPRVCDRSKYALYASGQIDPPSSSETIVAGQNPPYVSDQPWPWDIDTIINKFKSTSVDVTRSPYNWSCSGGDCGTQANATLGTLPPGGAPVSPVSPSSTGYQVTYVPGNVQLSGNNSQGFGVLLVDGNLDIHGGFQFDGLIVVKGVISFTGGGSAGVNVYGGVIAGTQSLVDNTLGGSINVNYDYCALPQGDNSKPPTILSLRDVSF